MAMGKCIMCGNDAAGDEVEDTIVIQKIRSIKRSLKMAQNNKLIVCPNCIETHAKKRKEFEGKLVTYLIICAGIVALIFIFPLISGAGFNIGSLFLSLLLATFMLILSLISYVPPLARGSPSLQVFSAPSAAPVGASQPSAASAAPMPAKSSAKNKPSAKKHPAKSSKKPAKRKR